ncbi:MerR family transcriptional regulator [Altererythrobacter sp.]|uniref:MerR family transcriptional regulator n=1 Tax=Altererythrobacter sp. TaxID=1872480 RepID=UPI003D048CC3
MSTFDDGKDAEALRTIGEVSEGLGIKPHVLRYWEQQFSMLKPLKRSGGRRYYRPEDVELVEKIDRLVNSEGYTLKGAHAAIRAGKGETDSDQAAPTNQPAPGVTHAELNLALDDGPTVAEILPELKAIRARLAAIIEA